LPLDGDVLARDRRQPALEAKPFLAAVEGEIERELGAAEQEVSVLVVLGERGNVLASCCEAMIRVT
jgi:hypothetical protein